MSLRLDRAAGVVRSLVVYYGQPWRRRSLRRFYESWIVPGDLVFDIGAHVGNRSKTLMSLGAEVVAIEPQPAFADLIETHLAPRLKGFERVAVGASAGEITLRISSRHPTVTSTSSAFIDSVSQTEGFRRVKWDQEVTVPMTTLDALITKYGKPVFCKIDCEGAEADILRGLSTPIKHVAFEYIPAMPSVTIEAIKRLNELGAYRFNRVIGETHRFVGTDWISAEALLKDLSDLSSESISGDVYARLEE